MNITLILSGLLYEYSPLSSFEVKERGQLYWHSPTRFHEMALNQVQKQLHLNLQVPLTRCSIRWDISKYQRYHKEWCFLIREAADPSAALVSQVGYQPSMSVITKNGVLSRDAAHSNKNCLHIQGRRRSQPKYCYENGGKNFL
jgi:hypothetical protein